MINKLKSRSVLIFRVGQLGDTLVAMPAIKVIREKYQDHVFILLTDRHPPGNSFVSSWDLLGATGWFDEVIFYTPDSGPVAQLRNMLTIAKKLRSMSLDYVYDLSPERTFKQFVRDKLFFHRLAGARNYKSSGVFHYPGKGKNGCLPCLEPEWKRLLKLADADAMDPGFRLQIPQEQIEHVQDIFKSKGIKDGARLLAIGPGSKMSAKRWPKKNYVELGTRLLKNFPDLVLLVLGGREDTDIGNYLCQQWKARSHNLAGIPSIYGSAAVIDRCLAYLGNDTGTMHLAAMVGRPCLALFSARDYPGMWEPYGRGHRIFRYETDCARCMMDVCDKENKCMNMISVDDVFTEVKTLFV